MDHKLIAMHNKAHVSLRSYSYQAEWTCAVESTAGDMQFKIEATGATPTEALNAAHEKWCRITGAVPEFIGMLPPPDDSQDGDQFITQPPVDDDIPF